MLHKMIWIGFFCMSCFNVNTHIYLYIYVCVGAEIDCEDKSRNTALHIAARYGHELIITALIKHGASTAKLVTTDIQPSVCP